MSATKPTIPTLQAIRDRMMADVAYYLPGSGNRPYKSVLSVLVTVFAAAVWSLYLFADWILRQLDPATADEAWLVIWGDKLGVPRKPDTVATGSVTLSGNGTIPAGTLLQSSDQRRYVTLAEGVAGSPIAFQSQAAGYAGNIPTPSTLSLVNPIAGVQLIGSATAITGGLDAETLSAWAQRISDQLQQMQQIGDADDYARWAKAAHTAITDAWVYGNTPALGDITIYCLLTPGVDAVTVLQEAEGVLDRTRNVCGHVILRTPATLPITVRIAGIPSDARPFITADIAALIQSKRTRTAVLYPEELERLIANNTDAEFVLLEPVRKVIASDTEIMSLSGVTYE
ncbi:MAG: hypothetical protein BWK73_19135 [Thiothrix lacustris]|uniref:Baseplate protein J-like barrel domain-containing protein n=1 Tax=Thiothrix lacustris TaxID=525917 RepID=A0A1Y1QPN6_9GAMM|nr:MAG: hypothetical protein BWK73_19135 [Thiothrix lacustris]